MIDEAVSLEGCLDGWEGTKDIGSPFGDGVYRKKSVGARANTKRLRVLRVCLISGRRSVFIFSGPNSLPLESIW